MNTKPHYRFFSPLKFVEQLSTMSYYQLFATWTVLLVAFAQVYFSLSLAFPKHGVEGIVGTANSWEQWGDSLYFSIITSTTVGYGDLTPLGFSRAAAAMEAMLGFVILAIFVSKIVSQKQEIALFNVHKLAFQNAFSTTREGFFILRRDCDVLIAEMESTGRLSAHGQSNLLVLMQKSHVLLHDVRDFYDDFDWYNLDVRREVLMLESVTRTFKQFVHLYSVLDRNGIAWRNREDLTAERAELRKSSIEVLHHWEKHAAPQNAHWFAEIRAIFKGLPQD